MRNAAPVYPLHCAWCLTHHRLSPPPTRCRDMLAYIMRRKSRGF